MLSCSSIGESSNHHHLLCQSNGHRNLIWMLTHSHYKQLITMQMKGMIQIIYGCKNKGNFFFGLLIIGRVSLLFGLSYSMSHQRQLVQQLNSLGLSSDEYTDKFACYYIAAVDSFHHKINFH